MQASAFPHEKDSSTHLILCYSLFTAIRRVNVEVDSLLGESNEFYRRRHRWEL